MTMIMTRITILMMMMMMMMIIMPYAAAFPQSGSIFISLESELLMHLIIYRQALFEKCPRIGLVQVGRLCQHLNISTQGWRVAQTRYERTSLVAPESDPLALFFLLPEQSAVLCASQGLFIWRQGHLGTRVTRYPQDTFVTCLYENNEAR